MVTLACAMVAYLRTLFLPVFANKLDPSHKRQSDQTLRSHIQKSRSAVRKRTRPRCDLRSTLIWWRTSDDL
jgi:hypothetical protein